MLIIDTFGNERVIELYYDGYGFKIDLKKIGKVAGKAITGAVSGAATGFIMSGFNPIGAIAGGIGGAVTGGISKTTKFLPNVLKGGAVGAVAGGVAGYVGGSVLPANSWWTTPLVESKWLGTTGLAQQGKFFAETGAKVATTAAQTAVTKQGAVQQMVQTEVGNKVIETITGAVRPGGEEVETGYEPKTGNTYTTAQALTDVLKAGAAVYIASEASDAAVEATQAAMVAGNTPEEALQYGTNPYVQGYMEQGYPAEEAIQLANAQMNVSGNIEKYTPYLLWGGAALVVLMLISKPTAPPVPAMPPMYYPPPPPPPVYYPPMPPPMYPPYPYYPPMPPAAR